MSRPPSESWPERDQALTLIGRIYDGALHPETWPRILPDIVQFVGGNRGILFTSMTALQDGGFAFLHEIPETFLQQWSAKYVSQDLWTIRGLERGLYREGNAVLGTDLATDEEFARSPVYHELARHYGIGRLCTGIVFGPESLSVLPTVCSVFRSQVDAPFHEEHRDRMAVLVPHLSRALGVMIRLRGAELKLAATLAALDRLDRGVVLLDGIGEITFVNRVGRELLHEEDGLRMRSAQVTAPLGRLVANDPREQAAIENAIAECLRPTALRVSHFSSALSVSRPSGRRPYVLQVAPLPSANEFRQGSKEARAIVFVNDPEAGTKVDAALARRLYGLTPAEVRLVEALCSGRSLASAAELNGVSVGTARTQLKSIFRKANVSRQADLLRVFLALESR